MATPTDTGQAQRDAASMSAKLASEARDRANAAANSAQVQALQAIVSSLPPPVNVAANGLSTAIYAVLKAKPLPTSNTSPTSDPAKVFALGVAFAVLSAMWCFIKSILNPLPFIGSFFPLCEPSNDQQITRALAATSGNDRQSTVTSPGNSNGSAQQQVGDQQIQPSQGRGITFADYLAATAATVTTTGTTSSSSAQIASVLAVVPSGSFGPQQPTNAAIADFNSRQQVVQEPTNSDALRRLFGL